MDGWDSFSWDLGESVVGRDCCSLGLEDSIGGCDSCLGGGGGVLLAR